MVKLKFPGIVASAAVAVILSQSSCGFQKSPSEIAQEITVLIDECGSGSGVMIKKEDNTYLVLTARHVVGRDLDCSVITPDQKIYSAKAKNFTYYQGLDLAVVQFESDKNYPVAKLGKSEEVKIGNTVHVAGAPQPNEIIPKRAIQVSEGKIISIPSEGELGYTLVYDNSTKRGMSGGPVLDEKGKVIGIHGRGEIADGSKDSYGIPIQRFVTAKKGQNPEDYYLSEGSSLADRGDYEEARDAYIKVIEINPKNAYGYAGLGYVANKLDNKLTAILYYNKAIEINPNYADAYINRGNARSDLGEKKSAIADYNKAIKINPNNDAAYNNRGLARSELGDKESAIADYNKAIEINPNNAIAYNGRGAARYKLGDFQSAIADYNKAIEINPNYAIAYYNRGIARSDLGDKESAIADYNKAIEINPNNADAYYNRGNASSELGDKKSAIADYNKAIEINPNYANAYYNRGLARSDLGDKKSAIADYNKAIEINPNDAFAYYNRGNTRSDLRDKQGAIADFEKAAELLKKDGNEYWYQDALNRIKKLRGE